MTLQKACVLFFLVVDLIVVRAPQVETRAVGTTPSGIDETPSLTAVPAEIVLRPGGRRVVSLDYKVKRERQAEDYEVVVEQLPIIYLKLHETDLPKTMVVTRYIADIKVRPRENSEAYALSGLGQHIEGVKSTAFSGKD